MIGGLMKTTSQYALAAAAGLFVGALAFTPAKAADLGGDCCADLEERVAELEATTARKGNRVVSLQVSGRVNRAIMVWDDGVDSDVYHVDNDHSSSRLGFSGSGAMKPGWTAGYDVVFNVQEADSSQVSQQEHDTNDSGQPNAFDIRRARVYLQSEQFGRVTLGQGQSATDGTSEVDLGYGNYSNDPLYNFGFTVRDAQGIEGLTYGDLGFNLDGAGRTLNFRYDTPSFYGFILSTSFGENDYADVALRFSKEWNSIRFAAAAGYVWRSSPGRLGEDEEPDEEQFSASASIMHTPSGLFLTGAYAQRDIDDSTTTISGCAATDGADPASDLDLNTTTGDQDPDSCAYGLAEDADGGTSFANVIAAADADFAVNPDENQFYSVKGGIQKDFTGLGATTVFGFYSHFEDFATGSIIAQEFAEDGSGETDIAALQVTDTDKDMYAFGINQNFASAALDIYAHFEYTETNIDGVVREFNADSGGEAGAFANSTNADLTACDTSTDDGDACSLDTEDFWTIVVGSRIRF